MLVDLDGIGPAVAEVLHEDIAHVAGPDVGDAAGAHVAPDRVLHVPDLAQLAGLGGGRLARRPRRGRAPVVEPQPRRHHVAGRARGRPQQHLEPAVIVAVREHVRALGSVPEEEG